MNAAAQAERVAEFADRTTAVWADRLASDAWWADMGVPAAPRLELCQAELLRAGVDYEKRRGATQAIFYADIAFQSVRSDQTLLAALTAAYDPDNADGGAPAMYRAGVAGYADGASLKAVSDLADSGT